MYSSTLGLISQICIDSRLIEDKGM